MKIESRNAGRLFVAMLAAGLVLLLTGFGAVAGAPSADNDAERQQEAAAQEAPAADESRFVFYYFHGTKRCKTCRTIEAYADEVIQSRFAKQLKDGSLSWQAVNFDEPENEHFLEDFGLVSSSLVVVEMSGGETVRFEVLQEAWRLVRDKQSFGSYVHRSLLEFLG